MTRIEAELNSSTCSRVQAMNSVIYKWAWTQRNKLWQYAAMGNPRPSALCSNRSRG